MTPATRARSFRFKECAGEVWSAHDPWWRGGDASVVRFGADGRVRFDAGGMSFPGGGAPPAVRWEFVELRRRAARRACAAEAAHSAARRDWRGQPPTYATKGVRVDVGGHAVPSYCVRREPANWGWVMESCWVVYTSFPAPRRRGAADPPVATGGARCRRAAAASGATSGGAVAAAPAAAPVTVSSAAGSVAPRLYMDDEDLIVGEELALYSMDEKEP